MKKFWHLILAKYALFQRQTKSFLPSLPKTNQTVSTRSLTPLVKGSVIITPPLVCWSVLLVYSHMKYLHM